MSARRTTQRTNGPLTPAATWTLRQSERALLLWSALCIGLGFAMIVVSQQAAGQTLAPAALLPFGLYLLCLLGLHLAWVLTGGRADQPLCGAFAFLLGFGMLAQYRMGSLDPAQPFDSGLMLFALGTATLVGAGLTLRGGRWRLLGARPWWWAVAALGLLGALVVFGQRYRGALYAGGLTTPTELLKVIVVVFLAGYIAHHAKALADWGRGLPRPPWRALWPLAAFWLALTALLLAQRDLGMCVILTGTLLVMLAVGSKRWRYLVLGTTLATLVGSAAMRLFPHGQQRIAAWLAPFDDPTGDSWQVLQGLSGMYSGGLWGEGFGAGRPDYTPIAQSDFIYSVIGEELGLVGCALLVAVFLVVLARGLRIAEQTRDPFGRLLALGLTTVLALQTLLNLGGVTGLVPLTGITLPFISHGGTSLLTACLTLGLLLALSEGVPKRTARKAAERH